LAGPAGDRPKRVKVCALGLGFYILTLSANQPKHQQAANPKQAKSPPKTSSHKIIKLLDTISIEIQQKIEVIEHPNNKNKQQKN